MGNRTYTRRRALQLGGTVGAGLVTALAGCSDDSGSGNGNGNDTTTTTGDGQQAAMNSVPSGTTIMASMDVSAMLNDDMVKISVNEGLALAAEQQPNYTGPTEYSQILSQAESELGLDPEGLSTMTMFGSVSGGSPDSAGAIMSTEWSESDLVSLIEQGEMSVSEESYGGKTIYVAEDAAAGTTSALGVLGDGRFTLGTRGAVESVIDTDAGDAEAVSGAVVSAYENSPEGLFRFGADLSDVSMGDQSGGTGGSGGLAANTIGSVTEISGGLVADGNTREMVVDMQAESEDAATALRTLIQQGLATVQQQAEQDPQLQEEFGDEFAQLENIEVTSDGTTASVSYSAAVEDFAGLVGMATLAVVATFFLGLGTSTQPRMPQANFGFEYDGEAQTVTITHQAGDSIPADQLRVVTASGADSWARLSETLSGSGTVTAGESVSLSLAADETARVVYRSEEGMSSVLAEFSAPSS